MALLEKHRRFVAAYLRSLNGRQAAIDAGYSADSAGAVATQLLKRPDVAKAINGQFDAARDAAQLELEDLLEAMGRALLADHEQAFDADGAIKPLSEWPEDLRLALQDLEVRELIDKETGAKVGAISKLKFVSKEKAVTQLAKLKGLYAPEKHEVNVDVADRLAKARARARAKGSDT